MTVLNQQQTNDLFCDIESRLLGASLVILEYLNNLPAFRIPGRT